jgi:hypothetical protein
MAACTWDSPQPGGTLRHALVSVLLLSVLALFSAECFAKKGGSLFAVIPRSGAIQDAIFPARR